MSFTVLPQNKSVGENLSGLSGSLLGGYLNNLQQTQERNDQQSKLAAALQQVENMPGITQQQKQTLQMHRTLSGHQDTAKQLSDLFQGNERLDIERNRNLVTAEANKRSQEDLNAYRNADLDIKRDKVKNEANKPQKSEPLTPFEKAKQTQQAKEYLNAKEEIPKIENSLQNLDRIDELAGQLKGLLGFGKLIPGMSGVPAEMEAMGLAAVEPIVKIFNPVGPIPIQKLKLIQERFAPKPTDSYQTATAKTNALRLFGKQALARAKERVNLMDQYQGNPPDEILNSFDKESNTMLDAMSSYNPKKEEKTEGKKVKVKNKETGQTGTVTWQEGMDTRYERL